jgi:DivIVA domain-containing protein
MGVERPTFTRTRVREGYDCADVDRAVDRIMESLSSPHPSIGAGEVAELRFKPIRFGAGYDMVEVDGWLDEVVVALGGRPVEALPPEPVVAPPFEQVDDGTAMSEAAMDRWQAAAIIVVTLVVTVLIYVWRF